MCPGFQETREGLEQDTLLMNSNPTKCKVMKMGHSERKLIHDKDLAGEKLLESASERDLKS